MKKLLALLLTLCVLLSLTACGEKEETSSRRKNRKNTESTTQETTEEPTEQTEAPVIRDYDSPYTEFEQMDVTIIDDENITVHIGKLKKGDWGPTCEVTVENKTNIDLEVFTLSTAINDRMDYSSFYVEATADGETSSEMNINSDMKVKDITRISMSICYYDQDSYEVSGDYLIDIYPNGKDAHEYNKPARKGVDTLLEEDDLYISVTEYQREDESFHILYRAINDSEELLSLSLNPISFNGFGATEFGGGYILPDTYIEDAIWCTAFTVLQQLGMEDITYMDLEVGVYTIDDQTRTEETITVYPKGESKAEEFVYEYADDDVVVYEDDNIKLTMVNYEADEYDCGYMYFIMQNKKGSYLYLYCDVTKINNSKTSESISIESSYGLDTYGLLYLHSSVLEQLKSNDISSMELTLQITDEDFDTIYEGTVNFDLK